MIENFVALQGVCAWPNLTLFPDGTIVATIFNQPCHGRWEGDLDCYASTDGGEIWYYRGRPCPHEPGKNRMNCAAGLAGNGDMIVLCSGWDNRLKPFELPYNSFEGANILRAWVCRSSDQGKTWQRVGELPDSPGTASWIPFGDVVIADDGTLRVTAYTRIDGDEHSDVSSYMLISEDDGNTWRVGARISGYGNETALLSLSKGRWLAAARTTGSMRDVTDIPADRNAPEHTLRRLLNLYASDDDGASWHLVGPVSLTGQIPGHLLRLKDGRIVLTYGNRCPNNLGVDARISRDGGASWGRPIRLADMGAGDGGYPSTVEREDGQLVTAYYNKVSGAFNYEMSIARWDINEYEKRGPMLDHAL